MKTSPVLSPPETRDFVIDHIECLESQSGFGEPTEEDLAAFEEAINYNLTVTEYKVNRGIREIAADLDMNVSHFEAMLIGKTVLDVGCGLGRLSTDISRLKRTRVTALDNDPGMIDKVQPTKNLTPVLGSAYELPAALGGERFEIVISAFSGHHWVRNPEQRILAIKSALEVCEVGGTTIFIPVLSNVAHGNASRKALNAGLLRGGYKPTQEEIEKNRKIMRVYDWLDVLTIDSLLQLEEGRADCTFVSSRENRAGIPVLNAFSGKDDPAQDRYSAIVDILSE